MKASDQCIKTKKCGSDGQSKQRITERFVKFVPSLPRLTTNILNLSESALNSLKKPELVQKILDLKGKVIVDTCISYPIKYINLQRR